MGMISSNHGTSTTDGQDLKLLDWRIICNSPIFGLPQLPLLKSMLNLESQKDFAPSFVNQQINTNQKQSI
jgi:hypothetical protein